MRSVKYNLKKQHLHSMYTLRELSVLHLTSEEQDLLHGLLGEIIP